MHNKARYLKAPFPHSNYGTMQGEAKFGLAKIIPVRYTKPNYMTHMGSDQFWTSIDLFGTPYRAHSGL